MASYPECEKMSAVKEQSQVIGEFLEWLATEKGVWLAQEEAGDIWQYHYSPEKLLAEFFNIDLKKVEQERQQMLEELRKVNDEKQWLKEDKEYNETGYSEPDEE